MTRFRKLALGGLLAIPAVLTVVVSMSAAPQKKPALAFHWDFTQRHDVSTVPWPASNHTNTNWWGLRKISLTAQIDQARLYRNDDVAGISVMRNGSRLLSVTIDEQPATADAACGRVSELLRAWGGEPVGLEDWRSRVSKAGDSVDSYLMNLRESESTPAIAVEIFPAAATPDRPWHVVVQLVWKDAAFQPATRSGTK